MEHSQTGWEGRLNSILSRWPPAVLHGLAACLALLLSLAFYFPRTEVFAHYNPSFQEWSRARTFMLQCDHPLRTDIEPAMRWRLLPPLVCHAISLRSYTAAFVAPWAGLLVLLGVFSATVCRLARNPAIAVLATLGLAASGNAITITNWLGINDAWYLVGLCAVCGGSPAAAGVAAVLCPWVDERFLIALPLALLVRRSALPAEAPRRAWSVALAAFVPYVAVRSGLTLLLDEKTSSAYVGSMLAVARYYLAYIPLGWWMGYRLLWIPIAYSCRRRPALAVAGAATLVVISALAWDLSRSTGVLLPIFLLAAVEAGGAPRSVQRGFMAVVVVNFFIPFSHVVGPTLRAVHGFLG